MKKTKRELKKFSPIVIFTVLTIITIALSALLPLLGSIKINGVYPLSWLSSGEITSINDSGELITSTVSIESLFNVRGIRYIFGNIVSNFISFAPLGYLFIALVGISIFNKSGLLKSIITVFEGKISNALTTLIIITLGVISSLFGTVGYVLLIPLAALIFEHKKRNPLIGIIAAFVGVAGGYGVNFLLGELSLSLNEYTTKTVALISEKYTPELYGNYFFMIVASIIIIILSTIITEKIISPKFSSKKEDTDEFLIIGKKEKRGFLFAGVSTLLVIIFMLYMIIPGMPYSGLLLDNKGTTYLLKLFGPNSVFKDSIIVIITIILFVSGISYAIGTKTLKNKNGIANMIMSSSNNIGYLIILIFFASVFISIFKYTQIGTLIVIQITELMNLIKPTGFVLVIVMFILFVISNMFLTSPTLKWAIMAPTFVQIANSSFISPEFTEAIYKAALGASNLITPLLAYYIIYLGYLQIYSKNETITLGKSYKFVMPYFWFFSLAYLILIVIWYIINIPIGPGVFPIL